jgi:AraC-like DNA-binding protein
LHNSDFIHREQRATPFGNWSPSIHYAQYQRLPPGLLSIRRIYDFELLYVHQGEAATLIGNQRYRLPAGKLIFIPSGMYHQNEVVSSPDAKFLGIHFDFFDELDFQTDDGVIVNEGNIEAEKFGAEAIPEAPFAPLSANLVYTPSLLCVQLMEQLVHEFTSRSPGYTLICKALILNILALLLRTQTEQNPANLIVHNEHILALAVQIEAAPSEPWTNRLLAKRLNLNEDHMSKMFKKIIGMPPGEYIQTIRLREAKLLLRETNVPIMEVGRWVGYEDIHYFSRLFRKSQGISPREYRQLSRKALSPI